MKGSESKRRREMLGKKVLPSGSVLEPVLRDINGLKQLGFNPITVFDHRTTKVYFGQVGQIPAVSVIFEIPPDCRVKLLKGGDEYVIEKALTKLSKIPVARMQTVWDRLLKPPEGQLITQDELPCPKRVIIGIFYSPYKNLLAMRLVFGESTRGLNKFAKGAADLIRKELGITDKKIIMKFSRRVLDRMKSVD